MTSIIKDLIEYFGIVDTCHLPHHMTSFKQFTVQETLTLPAPKPDIEQIIRVMADASIINTKIIKTPIGVSLDGQNLTGWKLIVEGILHQKIEYVADEPTQSVHATHFKIPFSTFIVLPHGIKNDMVTTVIPYIEDIYLKQLDKRHVFKNIILLLDTIL